VNIKDYISSGLVESYVLGLASEEEKAEFEYMCTRNPELVSARIDFEIALERQLLGEPNVPVTEAKDRIMNAIRQEPSVSPSKVITMENVATARSTSPMRWVAAASIILLLASAYFAVNFYSRNKELEAELVESKKAQTEMDRRMKTMEIMSDPNVAVVNLKGTEKAPASSASVYWDSTNQNVYLVVKNMPRLPSEKQYQLWSLINAQDGSMQPTSLGLFDVGDDKKLILKMDKAQKADAFAITIETRGNKAGPNLEELQSMGKTGL
jgi:anti-sigma-K factor RskA